MPYPLTDTILTEWGKMMITSCLLFIALRPFIAIRSPILEVVSHSLFSFRGCVFRTIQIVICLSSDEPFVEYLAAFFEQQNDICSPRISRLVSRQTVILMCLIKG